MVFEVVMDIVFMAVTGGYRAGGYWRLLAGTGGSRRSGGYGRLHDFEPPHLHFVMAILSWRLLAVTGDYWWLLAGTVCDRSTPCLNDPGSTFVRAEMDVFSLVGAGGCWRLLAVTCLPKTVLEGSTLSTFGPIPIHAGTAGAHRHLTLSTVFDWSFSLD